MFTLLNGINEKLDSSFNSADKEERKKLCSWTVMSSDIK